MNDKNRRNKKCTMWAAVMSATVLLTACGQNSPEVTSLEIDKEGAVTNVIYEEFQEEYLDVEDLKNMAGSEIEAYNNEYISPRISLGEVELIDDGAFVKLSMTFKTADDFSNFNQETVFYGTVQEARDAGYTVSDRLVDKSGEQVDEDFIDEHKDNHIVITTDKSNFKTPYKIRYMSKGVVLLGDKEAVLQDVTGDTVQLLLTK